MPTPDRVRVSFGANLQPERFNQISVEISLDSDVKTKETPEKAFKRVTDLLAEKLPQVVNTAFEQLGYEALLVKEN